MDRSKFPTIHVCRFNSGHKYYIPQYKGVDIVNKLKYTGGEFEVRKKKVIQCRVTNPRIL